MTTNSPFNKWPSLLIVLATGILFGFFIWKASSFPSPNFPVELGSARWISAADGTPQAYFRKEIYVNSTVKRAWLLVAATDSFKIYLNGQTLGSKESTVTTPTGVYDLSPLLLPGKNVFAVEVRRQLHPGAAAMVIKGAYADSTGREELIFSGDTWKASPVYRSMGNPAIPWFAPNYDDTAWPCPSPAAEQIINEERVRVEGGPPEMITMPPAGRWVGPPDPGRRDAAFSKILKISNPTPGVWLRVAAKDRYEIMINGRVWASSDIMGNTMDVYDIWPALSLGKNVITVNVSALSDKTPLLLLDIFRSNGETVQQLAASGEGWDVSDGQGQQGGQPTVFGDFSPYIDKLICRPKSPTSTEVRALALWRLSSHLLAATLLVAGLWGSLAQLLRRSKIGFSSAHSQLISSFFLVPSLLLLCLLLLFYFDIRFTQNQIINVKTLLIPLLAIVAVAIGFFAESMTGDSNERPSAPFHLSVRGLLRQGITMVLLIIIVGGGIVLRGDNGANTSLSHDEINIALISREILTRGYPVKIIGPIEKPLTTYEALPFPIALSMSMLGVNDFAVRLPALLFSSFTALLIFYIGRRYWGWRVGMLATACYAYMPFAIFWGSNAFHPQQAQFLTLITSYLFLRAIESDELDPKYLYGSAIGVVLTYLTWEASGIILPAYFICLLAMKGKKFNWIRSRHLWYSIVGIGIVVFCQLSRRIFANYPFTVVGKGLSGATLALAFLEPSWDITYYLKNFLLAGNNTVLTLVAIVGIPVLFRDQTAKFFSLLLFILLFILCCFLPNESSRYTYFTLPFLVLSSSMITIRATDYFREMSTPVQRYRTIRTLTWLVAILLPCFLFISSNNQMLHLYRLGYFNSWFNNKISPIIDYQATSAYITKNYQAGDVIISLMPHALDYYSGKPSDYYLQEHTLEQIVLDPRPGVNKYLDKYSGSQVLRNIGELQDVTNKHRRVWLIASPYDMLNLTCTKETMEFINNSFTVAHEDYLTRIFLWER